MSEPSCSHIPALVCQHSCRRCLHCRAEMRMNLRRWLRLPLQNSIPTGPCVCSTTSHAPALSSHHLLKCRNEGMLGRRHDDLRRTLRDMATTAGLIAEEEPRPGSLWIRPRRWEPSHLWPPPWTVHCGGCVRRLGARRRTGNDCRQPRRARGKGSRAPKAPEVRACLRPAWPWLYALRHREWRHTWERPSAHSALKWGGSRNADRWHHLGSVFLREILAPEDLCIP